MNDMNTTTKPGVIEVLDACETVLNRAGPWPVDKIDPRAYLVIREAKGNVELMTEALGYCESWFAKYSPTAALVTGEQAEHPMLTCIRAALARAQGGAA